MESKRQDVRRRWRSRGRRVAYRPRRNTARARRGAQHAGPLACWRSTLQQLAVRSGVSTAMLSEVERGRKSPTIRVAAQIAEGLGCAVSELLDDPPATQLAVLRRRERRRLIEQGTGIERHLLAPHLLAHGIEVVWYVVPKGRSSGSFPPQRHGVLAHATIVKGELESIAGKERIVLRAGDSINYSADITHEFRNVGRGVCEFFLVIDGSHSARSEIASVAPVIAGISRPGNTSR